MQNDLNLVVPPHGQSLDAFLAQNAGLNLNRLSALVLEHTRLLRETLGSVLRGLGFRDVRATEDPAQAFRDFVDRPADMVFTDWSPHLDGLGFLKTLRQDPASPNPYVPVIMVSANSEIRHVYQALNSGMNEYLVKPFNASSVYRQVHTAIAVDREFIRVGGFFGPDRRRRRKPPPEIKRRAAV